MTFEEWFEQEYPKERYFLDINYEERNFLKKHLAKAWEAGYDEGVEAMGGPVR